MAFVNKKGSTDWRTEDAERGIILRSEGGGGPDILDRNRKEFSLTHKNIVVKIVAWHHITKNKEGEIFVNWVVSEIKPRQLKDLSEQQLDQIVVEALSEYGFLYDSKQAKEVEVVIDFSKRRGV